MRNRQLSNLCVSIARHVSFSPCGCYLFTVSSSLKSRPVISMYVDTVLCSSRGGRKTTEAGTSFHLQEMQQHVSNPLGSLPVPCLWYGALIEGGLGSGTSEKTKLTRGKPSPLSARAVTASTVSEASVLHLVRLGPGVSFTMYYMESGSRILRQVYLEIEPVNLSTYVCTCSFLNSYYILYCAV